MDLEFQVYVAVVTFMWITYLWDEYLSHRQRRILKTVFNVPQEVKSISDQETFTKSRLYNLDRSNFGFWSGLWSQLEFTIILHFEFIPCVWNICGDHLTKFGYSTEYEILQSLLFVLYTSIFSLVTGFPWSWYSTFVIEERHGFNKQTFGFFVKDKLKAFAISLLIGMPVISGLIYIIRIGGPHFYVYAWLFTFVVVIFMMFIYPEFIAPLFDRYEPLPDGNLRTQIEALASSIGFPLKKLYVVEGSRRSAHSNAYFYGFWKNKRIVLFDTLLENFTFPEKPKKGAATTETEVKADDQEETTSEASNVAATEKKRKGCNDPEVLAILGHELGHWKMNHVNFNLIISQVNIFLMFFVFGQLLYTEFIFRSFGFRETAAPIIIRLLVVFQFMFSPYNTILEFLTTLLSRRFEFQADAFAAKMGRGADLKSGLVKLSKDNLSFLVNDYLYSMFTFSHPPVLERLRAIDQFKNNSDKKQR